MDTDHLLDRVALGESSAAAALLTRHQQQLRRMVQLRLDARLAARFDPSDIIQDALAEAHRRLPEHGPARPIAFYRSLRRIDWEQLLQMHRPHLDAKRRTGRREDALPITPDSEMLLAERLSAASTPSDQLGRRESGQRVRH